MSWLPWIVSGGTISYIALAVFAPSALQILTPILKAIVEGVIEYVRNLWNGAMDMLDNVSSVIFVASVAAVAYFYGVSSHEALQLKKEVSTHWYSPNTKKDESIFTHPLGRK
jgi:cytochrome P450